MKKTLLLILALCCLLLGCVKPDINGELMQAMEKALSGDYDAALAHTEICLQLSPECVNALLLHGFCLYSSPTTQDIRKANAFKCLEKATKLAPERFDVWFFYGWALYENGMNHDAIPPLEKALRCLPQDSEYIGDVKLMLGQCCAHNNLQQKALTYLQPLRVRQPYASQPIVWNTLGVLAVKRNSPQEAINFFAEAYKLDKGNPTILQNIAVTCDMYLGQPKMAKSYYQKTLQNLPPTPENRLLRQQVQNRLNRLNQVNR